nr:Chain C, P2 [Homo sapiens]
ALYGFKWA